MGIRYIAFRMFYEFQFRTGLLKFRFPVSPPFKRWITRNEWRSNPPPFFFGSRAAIKSVSPNAKLREDAQRIKAGEIHFFQGEWKKLEMNEWLLNPSTGYKYSNEKHWTEIPDFDPAMGDIKYVWEKSRFTFLQTILRSDAAFEEDSAAWVFAQIESWIDHNPINRGPNYRCSQEISLRVFNWMLALYFYKDSVHLTEERFEKIIFCMYWQMRHVRSNIHFSRIAVRNNHAISEALGIYTAGLLFPFFSESNEWRRKGKNWLEEEIRYQIYSDGAYLQFSFNYHRVVVQLLTWAFSIAEVYHDYFSDEIYDRAYRSLVLLATCQDYISSQLPNYGANDGSLFFRWNDQSYRNFSPSLDALHYFLTGKDIYPTSFEDRNWFGLTAKKEKQWPKVYVKDGCYSFTSGGLYVLRNEQLLVLIICASYKDRPSQADNLHIDVWYNGDNLLRDAGSYLYNTKKELVKYFFGTESHNTVMLGDADQMQKGSRFIWLNRSQALKGAWTGTETKVIRFIGSIKAFASIGSVIHNREIEFDLDNQKIKVVDTIQPTQEMAIPLRQIWHPTANVRFSPISPDVCANRYKRFYSDTYGRIEEVDQVEFASLNKTITTVIEYSSSAS